MKEQKPTIGRIVIFTVPSPEHPTANNDAKEVPAIITRVWSDTCVNLTVFADNREPVNFSSSQYSDKALPTTWRWHDDVVEVEAAKPEGENGNGEVAPGTVETKE